MSTKNITPRANGEGSLGTALKKWLSGYINTLYSNNITFPATQVPSSDANTLDDYEEGTFTPVLKFGGVTTGITYDSTPIGYYTKIGNLVTATGKFTLTSKGSSVGDTTITGLPFIINDGGVAFSFPVTFIGNVTFSGQFFGLGLGATDAILLYQTTELGVTTYLNNSNFSDTTWVYFEITYRV
jgi:hypothetical protein